MFNDQHQRLADANAQGVRSQLRAILLQTVEEEYDDNLDSGSLFHR